MAEAKSTAGALENTNYQLLPALHKDDYERLKADIALRGVMVPVEVDEDGAILDGHHRVMIARELGIKCPTKVRKGLPDYEKRLHAVALNLARRQLSDAQKTVLGEKIEPDIAERARRRMLAGKKVNSNPVENFPQGEISKSRDEVAQAVGLGSGKTYENHKKTLSEAKEVAPEVVEKARRWCGWLTAGTRKVLQWWRVQRNGRGWAVRLQPCSVRIRGGRGGAGEGVRSRAGAAGEPIGLLAAGARVTGRARRAQCLR